MDALHSGPGAKKQDVRDAGNLQYKLAIAVGARVMYVRNKWHAGKLINGSQGEVLHILYGEHNGPPDLPLGIVVKFDNYCGPPYLPGVPGTVCVVPYTCTWTKTVAGITESFSRTQIPLVLSSALTLYKVQGQKFRQLWWHPDKNREYQTGGWSVFPYFSLNLCQVIPICSILCDCCYV